MRKRSSDVGETRVQFDSGRQKALRRERREDPAHAPEEGTWD